MQAKLDTSELAYLFHVLEARRAVGVDNHRLFPAEVSIRDALLEQGLAKLQEHGWFVARDGAIDANDELMLMAAVVANPATTLAATHIISSEARQAVTYYLNQGIIVELFMAADGDYVLSRLETVAGLEARVAEVYSAWLTRERAAAPVVFASDRFEEALALAKAGDPGALRQAVVSDTSPELLPALARLQLVGHIESAALDNQAVQATGDVAILRAGDGACWLARNDERAATIELLPATPANLETMLEQLLDFSGQPA